MCTTVTTKEGTDLLQPQLSADLMILSHFDSLASAVEQVKPSGFLLLHSAPEALPAQGATGLQNLVVIAEKSCPSQKMVLYRKVEETKPSVLHIPIEEYPNFCWVTKLQRFLRRGDFIDKRNNRIYITSQNPNSGILGLFKCLLREEEQKNEPKRLRCIFDPEKTLSLNFAAPDPMLENIIKMDLVVNVIQNGQLGSQRHIPLGQETHLSTNELTKESEAAFISTTTPGDLSTLRWIRSPLELNSNANQHQELYDISYAALNFRDVLLATATIPIESNFTYKESYMGFEFSGLDRKGNRVMGLGEGGLLASKGLADSRFVWPVPQGWTLEEAATVPLVYATVLYAFQIRAGGLERGQKVLIHSGTGGIGISAINVALAHGCEVFTTVGSQRKRDILKSLFPTIQDDHIGCSRDTSFEAQFLEVTSGEGVDIVLNSLAGDKLEASIRCLGINGKFLEIGVYDAHKNTPLGMRSFLKNIQFHGIGLYHVMRKGSKYGSRLKELMEAGVESGAVKPLPTQVFRRDQAEEAFRFMASGNHVGKLLIKIRDEQTPSNPLRIPALSRSYFSQDKVYVVVGGLGGFGIEVADWLVDRGVRNLVLTSRSGVTNGYQSYCIRRWMEVKGVNVQVLKVDLAKREDAEAFIKASQEGSSSKIGGIFNCAMVLEDKEFDEQTEEAFARVSAPKAEVTKNLDELTRQFCPDLDHFVVFSSISCGKGTAEQTNYGWANSVMERICERRVMDGLHGLAIQWGVIGQVGFVAEKIMKNESDGTEVIAGTLPQNVESCLEILDAALLQRKHAVVASMVVAPKEKSRKTKKGALVSRMENIFGIKDMAETVSLDKKLSELGMDSMITFELKQTLERDYDLPLTKEVLRLLTVRDLIAIDAGTYVVSKDSSKDASKGMKHPEDCLIKLKSAGDGPQFFIVHGFLGGVDMFSPLASKLHADVVAFELLQDTKVTSIPEMAQFYIEVRNQALLKFS